MSISIASINLNGVRAAARKGLHPWLDDSAVDVVLGQEVRANADITADIFGDNWQVATGVSTLKGRSGVCIAVRRSSGLTLTNPNDNAIPDAVPEDGGRWIEADLTAGDTPIMHVISAYLHSGQLGTEKMDHKYNHLNRVTTRLGELANTGTPTLVAGDFNIVHTDKDIKNWKPNHNKRAGVLDDEIAYLDTWMNGEDAQWVDISRYLSGPDTQGPYTWWSWRGKAFDNNAGWRIDYHMTTRDLADRASHLRVDKAESYDKRFSDHAPLVVTYDV